MFTKNVCIHYSCLPGAKKKNTKMYTNIFLNWTKIVHKYIVQSSGLDGTQVNPFSKVAAEDKADHIYLSVMVPWNAALSYNSLLRKVQSTHKIPI